MVEEAEGVVTTSPQEEGSHSKEGHNNNNNNNDSSASGKVERKKRRAERQKKRKRQHQQDAATEKREGEEDHESEVKIRNNDDGDDENRHRKKKRRKLNSGNGKQKKKKLSLAGSSAGTSVETASIVTEQNEAQQKESGSGTAVEHNRGKKRRKRGKSGGAADAKAHFEFVEDREGVQAKDDQSRKQEGKEEERKKKKPQSRIFPFGNFNKYYNVRDARHIGKMPRVFVLEDHFALLASEALGVPYEERPDLTQLLDESNLKTEQRHLPQQRSLLDRYMKDKTLMDIGCNSGVLTMQMAQNLRLGAVLGIDIDSGLIRRAWKMRSGYLTAKSKDEFWTKFERQKSGVQQPNLAKTSEDVDTDKSAPAAESSDGKLPNSSSSSSEPKSSGDMSEELILEKIYIPSSIDLMDSCDENEEQEEGEAAEQMMDEDDDTVAAAIEVDGKKHDVMVAAVAKQLQEHSGSYTFPIFDADRFPENVRFATFNYVLLSRMLNDMQKDILKTKFNIVTCFSVTKWIHLNFGDRGIERLFRQVYDNLTEDGVFVLELQNFRSYRKRRHMTKRISAVYPTIKLRPNDFPKMLVEKIGFACHETRFVCRDSKLFKHFNRPIYFFYKQKPPGFDERVALDSVLRKQQQQQQQQE